MKYNWLKLGNLLTVRAPLQIYLAFIVLLSTPRDVDGYSK